MKFHRRTGHPVADDHPQGVGRFDVDEAIRPKAISQLPAKMPVRLWLFLRAIGMPSENDPGGDIT